MGIRTRRIARLLFIVTGVALWLVVVALALEGFAAYRYRCIDEAPDSVPPHPGWNPEPPVMRDAAQQGDTTEPVAEPEPRQTDTTAANESTREDEEHLGTLFASLSEDDRAMYARLQEEWIATYDRDGNNVAFYGPPEIGPRFGLDVSHVAGKHLSEIRPDADKQDPLNIEGLLETGRPQAIPVTVQSSFGAVPLELHCFPLRDPRDADGQGGAVVCMFRNATGLSMTEELARDHDSAQDPLWRVPWLEYRRNVRLNENWHTNNVGFRDDYVALPKPPGVVRIVCVGGSTTMEGASNELTYPNILERKLRQHFDADTIEVVNCGVGGIGSLGERKRALDYARLEPDLVVHYNFVNDACHDLYQLWDKEATPWQRRLRKSRFLSLYCNGRLLPARSEIAAQLERSTFRNLALLHECVAGKNIDIAVCSFVCPDYPTLSSEERDYFERSHRLFWQGKHVTFRSYCRIVALYNEKVRYFCAERGIHYVPVAENLKGGTNYFVDICHMHPAGIALKAGIIFNHLKDYVAAKLAGA